MGEKVQGRRSKIGRQKIDGERSKMVWETENSKKVHCTTHGHELSGRECWMVGGLAG